MSMPQWFSIAVISGKFNYKEHTKNYGAEKAAVIAAILVGKNKSEDLKPYIYPLGSGRIRPSLVEFGLINGYEITNKALYSRLLNPKEIDLWFALDKDGYKMAKKRVKESGRSTSKYYRDVFPDPVIKCGLVVPDPPTGSNFEDWFVEIEDIFQPWRERIWKAFCESS